MAGIMAKWIIPGLTSVIAGTAMMVLMTGASVSTPGAVQTPPASAAGVVKPVPVDPAGATSAPAAGANSETLITNAGSTGSIVTLPPPQIAPYVFNARIGAGRITLTGYVPDAATRLRLAGNPRTDASALELGAGAPARFDSAVDFGLNALARMSSGTFALHANDMTFKGVAATGADYKSLETTLAGGAPQGTKIVSAAISPPKASPYTWSATKAKDGTISFSGFVPDRAARGAIMDAIGNVTSDTTSFAAGAPVDFTNLALAGLNGLADLQSGKLAFDGTTWSLTGTADSADNVTAAKAEFDGTGLAPDAIQFDIKVAAGVAEASQPPAETAPRTPPLNANYVWSAQKGADGTISISGLVPNAFLQGQLLSLGGLGAEDDSMIAPGAPQDFGADALAGLATLTRLKHGTLGFANGKWSLAGLAPDAASAATALKNLGATIDTKDWTLGIKAPEATPEPPSTAKSKPVPSTPAPVTTASSPQPEIVPSPKGEAAPANPSAPVKAAPPPAATTPAPKFVFNAERVDNGPISISGDVPSGGLTAITAAAGNALGTALTVTTGAPADFVADASAGLTALGQLLEGHLAFDGANWSLTGRTDQPSVRTSVQATIAALPGGTDWNLQIAAPTPAAVCRTKLAEFSASNPVDFNSGSAHVVAGGDKALAELAADLKLCPDAAIDIAGYTDSDGLPAANTALSVSRAEAVVDALIKLGIKEGRLYAIGYGETHPLVPNTSSANKRKNRRIEVTLHNDAIK